MSEAIVEHWMHEPDAPDLRDFGIRACRWKAQELDHNDVDVDWARPAASAPCLDLLFCRSIGYHVDNWHPEWSALWIMEHGVGHALHIADRKSRMSQKIRKPAKAATTIVPLAVGQIVIFNAHRVHWLPSAEDGEPLIVANFEFDARPTREQVAKMIADAATALASREAKAA